MANETKKQVELDEAQLDEVTGGERNTNGGGLDDLDCDQNKPFV